MECTPCRAVPTHFCTVHSDIQEAPDLDAITGEPLTPAPTTEAEAPESSTDTQDVCIHAHVGMHVGESGMLMACMPVSQVLACRGMPVSQVLYFDGFYLWVRRIRGHLSRVRQRSLSPNRTRSSGRIVH